MLLCESAQSTIHLNSKYYLVISKRTISLKGQGRYKVKHEGWVSIPQDERAQGCPWAYMQPEGYEGGNCGPEEGRQSKDWTLGNAEARPWASSGSEYKL